MVPDPKISHILILIIITITLYINALDNSFVWDDNLYVVNNKYFKSYRYLPSYFTSNFCEGVKNYPCASFYRPIISIIHLLEYKIWGVHPFGWHLTSIIFHAGVVIMLYITGLYIFREYMPALIAGIIFAAHPAHVESISIIANITDAPTSIFYLFSLIFFIRYLNSRDRYRSFYIYSLLFFTLSLLSKEMGVTLPLIICIYELLFGRDEVSKNRAGRIIHYLPFVSILITYLFIRRLIIGVGTGFSMGPPDIYSRLLNIPYLVTGYIKLLFFPINLSLFRHVPSGTTPFQSEVYIPVLSLSIIIIIMVKIYFHSKELFFLFCWILVTIIPVLNIIPIPYPAVVDRFAYIPSIGFCLFMGKIINTIIQSNRVKTNFILSRTAYILVVIYLSIYSFGVIKRNNVLENDYSLWSDTVKKSPNSNIAHLNLAIAYDNRGEIDLAIKEFREVLRLEPTNHKAYNNLGISYHKKGEIDLAIKEYKEAIRLNRSFDMAHNNLGNAYIEKGLFDLAEREYKEVLRINPKNQFAHYNMGNLYYKKGMYDMAIKRYQDAIRIDPDNRAAKDMLERTIFKKSPSP